MNVTDVCDINTLIQFVDIKGIDNAPYSFYGKNKHILDSIKENNGYSKSSSIKEIIFYETNKDKSYLCKQCGRELKYNKSKSIMPSYCSSTCSSIFNKDIITRKRTETMSRLLADESWAREYKSKISIKSLEYNNSEKGRADNKAKSERLKNKILMGEFTPNVTNSWTKWTSSYNGKKFRSLFECVFYAYHTQKESEVAYEKLRIPYIYNNEIKTYIVDFIDEIDRVVYEIKPNSLIDSDINRCKLNALLMWATENKYKLEIITEDKLKEYLQDISDDEFKELVYKKYPKWKK